jgi:hypothetical protein
MILTFDLSSLKSSIECVEFLAQKGIGISHKLGARLLALNSAGMQFSPVVLEDARPSSPIEAFLLNPAFMDVVRSGGMAALHEMLNQHKLQECLSFHAEDSLIKCVSPLEEEKETLLPVPYRVSSELLVPTSISPHSLLSDRKFLEETTLIFLDSDDPALIIASLKKLTRAALLSGKDPLTLFRTAFSKENPDIWRATASTIREMVDHDLGTQVEAFLAETECDRRKKLFRTMVKDSRTGNNAMWGELILQIFINLLGTREFFILLGENREPLARLLPLYPSFQEDLVNRILLSTSRFNADELYELREFISSMARLSPVVKARLMKDIQKDNPPSIKTLALWLMLPIAESCGEKEIMLSCLTGLLTEHVSDPVLISMQKALLLKYLPRSLMVLTPIYNALPREFQLFYLEMMEHGCAATAMVQELPDEQMAIMLMELNGTDKASQRRIVRLRLLRNETLVSRLSTHLIDPLSLVDVIADIFASCRDTQEGEELLSLTARLIPETIPLSLQLLQNKEALGDDRSDYILFSAHFIYHTAPEAKSTGVKEIISYLDRLTREEGGASCGSVAIEGLGLIFSRIREKKSVISRFLQRVVERRALPFETRVRILSNLLLAPHATPPTREQIESYLLGYLTSRELHTPDLSFLLEELNRILKTHMAIHKMPELIEILTKAIALKLTQPTIHEIMRTERLVREPSILFQHYEQSPWTWDEITQALFIMLKLFTSSRATVMMKERILHLLSHVVRHYCAAREEKLSTFYLNEIVLFRIIRQILPTVLQQGSPQRLGDHVRRIADAIVELMQRGNEEILANEDLQHFMIIAASSMGSHDAELQREIVKYLFTAWRNGIPGAAGVLKKARDEDWVPPSLKRMMKVVP